MVGKPEEAQDGRNQIASPGQGQHQAKEQIRHAIWDIINDVTQPSPKRTPREDPVRIRARRCSRAVAAPGPRAGVERHEPGHVTGPSGPAQDS